MAMLYQLEYVGLTVFTLISLSLARTDLYSLDECNTSHSIHPVEGAIVKSQDGAYYTRESRNCSVIFQTLDQQSTFLIRFLHVDIKQDVFCQDHLSLIELYNLTSVSSVILDRFCGVMPGLPTHRVVYTKGGYLRVKWVTGAGLTSHPGFSISVTAISHDPETCAAKGKFQCGNFTCISQSLVCDGTPNCLEGEDEADCFIAPLADSQDDESLLKLDGSVQVIAAPMHPNHEGIGARGSSDPQTQPHTLHREVYYADLTSLHLAARNDKSETLLKAAMASSTHPETTTRSHAIMPVYTKADLFLVTLALLAMLVMFACCAWIGCCMNNTDDINDLTSSEVNLVDEHNRLQLEMNANAGYEHSEGMPETPPPTYDAIARQTSYVSHISQTSDQISIPPEYEEAVEWTNEHGRQRHSRFRHITRSRSTGRSTSIGMSGSRGPNFARLFSRSVSATTSASGAERSESATTPNTTTSTSDNNTTEFSSVFVDTSPEIVIHPAPLPRPASHPLMSTPQTAHQGIPPCPSEVIGDDDVFDNDHQVEIPSTQDSQNPSSDNVHPSFFL